MVVSQVHASVLKFSFLFQVYFEFPREASVETQEGEGAIFSPCENLSYHNNNNMNTNNVNSNNNQDKIKTNKLEWKEENLKCECPNSVNITWHLQVADGLRL